MSDFYREVHFELNDRTFAAIQPHFIGKSYDITFTDRVLRKPLKATVKITSVKRRGIYYRYVIFYCTITALTDAAGRPVNITHFSKDNMSTFKHDIFLALDPILEGEMADNFPPYENGPNTWPRQSRWDVEVITNIPKKLFGGEVDTDAETNKIKKVFEGKRFRITSDDLQIEVSVQEATIENNKVFLVVELPKDVKVAGKNVGGLLDLLRTAFAKNLKYINKDGMGFSFDLIGRFHYDL